MPPFNFTDLSKLNKDDLAKQAQEGIGKQASPTALPRPGSWGELGLSKANFVGVRGFIGLNSKKAELDSSGSPSAAALLGIDDWDEAGVLGSERLRKRSRRAQ